MTRRRFLELVSHAGGAAAAYSAMGAMGLIPTPAKARADQIWKSPQGNASGRRVLILGAGIAGLCAAYELGKAGYKCQVLEARTRVGGRAHTIRRGCVETETDDRSQTCSF